MTPAPVPTSAISSLSPREVKWSDVSHRQLLDVAFLRTHGVVPQYFGLGFIQLKLDPVLRLHVWVPDWPAVPGAVTELHDHRYPFSSTVLLGTLVHEIHALEPLHPAPFDQAWEVVAVSCKPETVAAPAVLGYARSTLMCSFPVVEGSTYRLMPDAFHRAHSQGPAVSLLARDPTEREWARVLRTPGAASTCPFSLKVSEEECWAKMEAIVRARVTPLLT